MQKINSVGIVDGIAEALLASFFLHGIENGALRVELLLSSVHVVLEFVGFVTPQSQKQKRCPSTPHSLAFGVARDDSALDVADMSTGETAVPHNLRSASLPARVKFRRKNSNAPFGIRSERSVECEAGRFSKGSATLGCFALVLCSRNDRRSLRTSPLFATPKWTAGADHFGRKLLLAAGDYARSE